MIYIKSVNGEVVHISPCADIWATVPSACGNQICNWEQVDGPATCKNCIRIIKAEAKKYESKEWRKVQIHPKKGKIPQAEITKAVRVVVDSKPKHYKSLEQHHGAILGGTGLDIIRRTK